ACVREALLHFRPRALAVELPEALGSAFCEAVERLPYYSVIAYDTPARPGEEPQPTFVLVEPSDPFAEAVRTARSLDIPVHFVDLSVGGYPLVREPLPDPYTVWRLGLRACWEAFARTPRRRAAADVLRERHMAALLQDIPGPVLLVCGMAHARGILEEIRAGRAARGRHFPLLQPRIYNPDPDSVREIAGEIPLVMVVYEWLRAGPGPEETWTDPPPPEEEEKHPPRPETPLDRITEADALRALESLLGMRRNQEGERKIHLTPQAERAVAAYLARLRDPRLRMPWQKGPAPPPDPSPAPQNPGSTRIFKFRAVAERRSQLRDFYAGLAQSAGLDRQRLLLALFDKAAEFYKENTNEEIRRWQMRVLTQFARNYSRLTGALLPDLFQAVVSARGVADDNYAYEVWDLGSFYPWEDSSSRYPGIKIRAGEVWMDTRKVTFRRRFPRLRERLVRVPVRPRPREDRPGEWAEQFERGTICSYPPEDVVIEEYGLYLKKKALHLLSAERSRVEPFTTSILDGIDMRETIRNWPEKHRVYVREFQKVQGGAGSVILIFDEDLEDRRFPWKMTWHGEHEQESDMAFYATPPQARIVGPGIARCEYGGLVLTYPPGRVFDVWSDPMYGEARCKSEVLLMAGLEYSQEKHVVYVASRPPRSHFRSLASRLGKKIVFIPIGQMSPVTLKKIRVFHVLSGHHLRRIAKDYIW
ncbi:MAG TPA: hypothetical protein VNO81_12865, partial [Candidatus Nitrosotenuis sp.]|nr:hypothetical protein [Candidatus Nitrosotenuis sp.]